MLDGSFSQIVEHLVAGDAAFAGHRNRFLEIFHIEIADAPGQNFAGDTQSLEGVECLFQRIGPQPMQQIAVDAVGTEPG